MAGLEDKASGPHITFKSAARTGVRQLPGGTTLVGSDSRRADIVFSVTEGVADVHCELHVAEDQVAVAPFPNAPLFVDGKRTTRPLLLPAMACIELGPMRTVELVLSSGDKRLTAPRAMTPAELLAFFPWHVSAASAIDGATAVLDLPNMSYMLSQLNGMPASMSLETTSIPSAMATLAVPGTEAQPLTTSPLPSPLVAKVDIEPLSVSPKGGRRQPADSDALHTSLMDAPDTVAGPVSGSKPQASSVPRNSTTTEQLDASQQSVTADLSQDDVAEVPSNSPEPLEISSAAAEQDGMVTSTPLPAADDTICDTPSAAEASKQEPSAKPATPQATLQAWQLQQQQQQPGDAQPQSSAAVASEGAAAERHRQFLAPTAFAASPHNTTSVQLHWSPVHIPSEMPPAVPDLDDTDDEDGTEAEDTTLLAEFESQGQHISFAPTDANTSMRERAYFDDSFAEDTAPLGPKDSRLTPETESIGNSTRLAAESLAASLVDHALQAVAQELHELSTASFETPVAVAQCPALEVDYSEPASSCDTSMAQSVDTCMEAGNATLGSMSCIDCQDPEFSVRLPTMVSQPPTAADEAALPQTTRTTMAGNAPDTIQSTEQPQVLQPVTAPAIIPAENIAQPRPEVQPNASSRQNTPSSVQQAIPVLGMRTDLPKPRRRRSKKSLAASAIQTAAAKAARADNTLTDAGHQMTSSPLKAPPQSVRDSHTHGMGAKPAGAATLVLCTGDLPKPRTKSRTSTSSGDRPLASSKSDEVVEPVQLAAPESQPGHVAAPESQPVHVAAPESQPVQVAAPEPQPREASKESQQSLQDQVVAAEVMLTTTEAAKENLLAPVERVGKPSTIAAEDTSKAKTGSDLSAELQSVRNEASTLDKQDKAVTAPSSQRGSLDSQGGGLLKLIGAT